MSEKEQPIYCDLTVFSAVKRKELAATVPDLFQSAQVVRELPDGYAFQFPNEPGLFTALANFVEHERQCCPFFHFTIDVTPRGGARHLRMRGGEDVKAFMQATWDDLQQAVSAGRVRKGSGHDLDDAINRAAPILSDTIRRARDEQSAHK